LAKLYRQTSNREQAREHVTTPRSIAIWTCSAGLSRRKWECYFRTNDKRIPTSAAVCIRSKMCGPTAKNAMPVFTQPRSNSANQDTKITSIQCPDSSCPARLRKIRGAVAQSYDFPDANGKPQRWVDSGAIIYQWAGGIGPSRHRFFIADPQAVAGTRFRGPCGKI